MHAKLNPNPNPIANHKPYPNPNPIANHKPYPKPNPIAKHKPYPNPKITQRVQMESFMEAITEK